MMCDTFGGLLCLIAVFAIAYLAVVIDHLEEGNNRSTDFFRLKAMVVCTSNGNKSFEEIAVGQRPLAAAFTAENPEYFAGIIAQANLPCYVAVSVDGMIGIKAFPRPNRIRRIYKVAPW